MKRFWLASYANENSSQTLSRETRYSVFASIWLILVVLGLGFLMRYANAPGDQGEILASWPIESRIQRSESKPTLMVFAHPKCPCTAATLEELSWIMARCQNKVDCHVLFFHPTGVGPDWAKTGNWQAADSIDGVDVAPDPQSRTASLFGVRTSGHALLYDLNGQLVFEGGITPSRGHRGDSIGRTALLSLIRGDTIRGDTIRGDTIRGDTGDSRRFSSTETAVDSACVFGCPLQSPEDAARRWPIHGEE